MPSLRSIFITTRSPDNARNPQIRPVSLSQSGPETMKINRRLPQSNLFWVWSGWLSMQNSRLYLLCVLIKMPGNLKFGQFHYCQSCSKTRKSTDRAQNLISSENIQNTLAYRNSDHSSIRSEEIARKPKIDQFHNVQLATEVGTLTDPDQNLTSFETDWDN